MKKRIIFTIGNLDIGGAEESLVRLCYQLNPNEFDITVLSIFGRRGALSDSFPNYVKVLYINRNRSLSFSKDYSRFWNLTYNIVSNKLWGDNRAKNRLFRKMYLKMSWLEHYRFIRYVKKALSNYRFDISVGCIEEDPSVISTQCIDATYKYIFYAHGSVDGYMGDNDAFDKCNLLIAKSRKLKDEIVRLKHYDENRIIVLHNVYDIDAIINRSTERIENNYILTKFVTVGRFHEALRKTHYQRSSLADTVVLRRRFLRTSRPRGGARKGR